MNTVLSGGRGPGHHDGARYFNKAELEATRAGLEEARHLPGIYYTSPEIYAMEVEKLFMRDWLVVARVEEIASPGDYMTMDIVGEPIIVCCNADGTQRRRRGREPAHGKHYRNRPRRRHRPVRVLSRPPRIPLAAFLDAVQQGLAGCNGR